MEWRTVGESGAEARFRFCPACGTTIAFVLDTAPDVVAIPVGTFGDPAFPAPSVSIYGDRRHRWAIVQGDGIDHIV